MAQQLAGVNDEIGKNFFCTHITNIAKTNEYIEISGFC